MTKKRGTYLLPETTVCDWCGQWTSLTHVDGRYQCGGCHRILFECHNGEIEMAKESGFVAHYTIHVEIEEITKEKAKQFPVKLMQTMHHAFPGLRVHIIRESDEDK
jgi:ribosomal protein S27AE